MVRQTVIVSDIHLSQAHPDDPRDPLWMRYRRAEHHPDDEFSDLVDHLLARAGGASIELVFNGDLFDFDAPWVAGGTSSFDEFPLTEQGCTEHVRRIMDDHPAWFAAVARLLVRGHRVLFLSGNHDVELFWPSVRSAITERLVGDPALHGADTADARRRVRFRSWFHVTEDRVYLEHGSQYDVLNGVRWAMLPLTRERDRIHPVAGKLAFKRTGARMGYFNPYYEETFYLGLSGYLSHFWQHYARSERHIARTWFRGSVETVIEIARHRHQLDWSAEDTALACAETGATTSAVEATRALAAKPAEDAMIPILRELWMDRVGLTALVVAATTGAGAFLGRRAMLATLGGLVPLFAAYEMLVPKPDLRTYDSPPESIRRLFDIHQVRGIAMGHTHRPFGTWDEHGKFHGNSGTWCPAFRDPMCTEPVLDGRPLLVLTSDRGELAGGLHWWRRGALEPDASARAASAQPSSATRSTETEPSRR